MAKKKTTVSRAAGVIDLRKLRDQERENEQVLKNMRSDIADLASRQAGLTARSPIDEICDEIIELIEENPSIAGQLAGLISKVKDLRPIEPIALQVHPGPPPQDSAASTTRTPWAGNSQTGGAGDHLIDPLRGDANRYEWSNEYLCEFNHDDNKPRLKVNQDDYRSVARAIEQDIDEHGTFSASEVHAHSSRDDGHQVPLTQLYLCTRFWRDRGLIQRTSGRKLKVKSAGSFAAAAEMFILEKSTPSGTPGTSTATLRGST